MKRGTYKRRFKTIYLVAVTVTMSTDAGASPSARVSPKFFSSLDNSRAMQMSWLEKSEKDYNLILKRKTVRGNLADILIKNRHPDPRAITPVLSPDQKTLVLSGLNHGLTSIDLASGEITQHQPKVQRRTFEGNLIEEPFYHDGIYSFEMIGPETARVVFIGKPGFRLFNLKTNLVTHDGKTGFTPAREFVSTPMGAITVESPLNHEARANVEIVNYRSSGSGLTKKHQPIWRHEVHGLKKGEPVLDSSPSIRVNADNAGKGTVSVLISYKAKGTDKPAYKEIEVLDLETGALLNKVEIKGHKALLGLSSNGTEAYIKEGQTEPSVKAIDLLTGKELPGSTPPLVNFEFFE